LNNEIFITIIITIYNKEKFIFDCLKSICSQKDKNFKLIIIDDGSNDASVSICKSYCIDDIDYTLILQSHKGVSYTRNIGLKLAKTKYILFVDGDDIIDKNTIKILNNIILNKSYDLVMFGIFHVLPNLQIVNKITFPNSEYENFSQISNDIVGLFDSGLMYSVCNKLFKIQIIKEKNIEFKNIDFGEDLYFVCDYLLNCHSMINISQCLYLYLQHTSFSLSKKYREDLFEIRKKEYLRLCNFFCVIGHYNDDYAREFLSRRYIERIVGCIENESSIFNKKKLSQKIKKINYIIADPATQNSARLAKLKSLNMKLLIFPIRHKLTYIAFMSGLVMTIVKNNCPRLFSWLKSNR